jgi:hypothetical protein
VKEFKIGDLVSIDIDTPTRYGIVTILEASGTHVMVCWNNKTTWHNVKNLRVVGRNKL